LDRLTDMDEWMDGCIEDWLDEWMERLRRIDERMDDGWIDR